MRSITRSWPLRLAAALAVAALTARSAAAQESAGPDSIPMGPTSPIFAPAVDAWRSDKVLRICGDPYNMPATDYRQQGYDNKIAELIAKSMGDSLAYLWWPERMGFVRNTLSSSECDVIMDVPVGFGLAMETRPYYRSTYYIVSRADRKFQITTLSDPALRGLKIGVNTIGFDYTNTPPAMALSDHGLTKHITGYSTFYGVKHHPDDIIKGVARGEVDVALVWGPIAGYYASKSSVPLSVVALPDSDSSGLPFAYSMALGVRHGDTALQDTLNTILEREQPAIDQILREYHIPTIAAPAP